MILVNRAADGANDGSSWVNAYVDLQDALEEARIRRGDEAFEIWIAAGVYKPDRGTGDRDASFQIMGDVALYGGFSGCESAREERDPSLHETALSGDLLDNDDFFAVSDHPCCQANADGCPLDACRAEVCRNMGTCCRYQHHGWGADCASLASSFCCELCAPTRCDNSQLLVNVGRGATSVVVDGMTIRGAEQHVHQIAPGVLRDGGGLYSLAKALQVRRVRFTRNAAFQAAAMLIIGGEEATVQDCLFVENVNRRQTGGVVLISHGFTLISASGFIDNVGGGLQLHGDGRVEQSRFTGNYLSASEGAGAHLVSGTHSVIGCMFENNRCEASGGGLAVGGFSAVVARCGFFGNTGGRSAGGLAIATGWQTVVIDSVFSGNHAGGGVQNLGQEINGGVCGGIADYSFPGALILNTTVVGNEAEWCGGVCVSGLARVENSILWGNFDHFNGYGQGAQFSDNVIEPAGFRYNVIQGWTGSVHGEGILDTDPLFTDPDGLDGVLGTADDHLRLRPDSPAIDAADPNPPLASFLDLDGHTRILCGRLDLGAYEFGIGDYDCDGIVTFDDYSAWPSCAGGPQSGPYASGCDAYDFDADDDVDLSDFAALSNQGLSSN